MDRAGIGDVAAGDGGAVQRQRLAAVDRELDVADRRALDAAVPLTRIVPVLVMAPPEIVAPFSVSVAAPSTVMVPLPLSIVVS